MPLGFYLKATCTDGDMPGKFDKLAQSFAKNGRVGLNASDNKFDNLSGHQNPSSKQLNFMKQQFAAESRANVASATSSPPVTHNRYNEDLPPSTARREIEHMLAQKEEIEAQIAEVDRKLAEKEKRKLQQGKSCASRPFSMLPPTARKR